MSLKVSILTEGVENISKLSKAFNDYSNSLKKAEKAGKTLKPNEMVKEFEKFAASLGVSASQLSKMITEMEKAAKTIAEMKKRINVPFTKLSGDINSVRKDIASLNKELLAIGKTSAGKLDNSMFMGMTRNYKASLELQRRLNSEIEKQAKLTADINMAKPKGSNAVLSQEVANLKKAMSQTAMLQKEYDKLYITKKKIAAQPLTFGEAVKDISAPFTKMSAQMGKATASARVLNAELIKGAQITEGKLGNQMYMGMVRNSKAALMINQKLNMEIEKQAQLVADINVLKGKGSNAALDAEVANLKKAQAETQKLIAQYEKLGGVKAKAAGQSTTSSTSSGATKIIERQVAAVEKLRQRINSLQRTKLPTEKFRSLKREINAVNVELAKTGKAQFGGIAGISTQLTKLETKFNSSAKAAKLWGGNMKYAMGGIARSMGAMTYSYAALAPLLAGIALGTSVKKVYELGTAFDYTTTYVQNLGTALGEVDASRLQDQLLSFETLRKGPNEMAMGLKEFAKAGVEASQSMKQIGEMSKFATLAELELGDAVKLVIGQSQAFDQSFSKSANMIAAAALNSATDIQELGTALSYTTELATVSGTTFDEVATAMAVMANAGIRGSKAGTAIRTSLLKMQAPSEKLKGMLDNLGISWSAFTEEGQVKGLREMFTELKRVTEALPPAQRVAVLKELFGLRALKGGANLIRSMGAEWDGLNQKILASTDGISFISEKYKGLEKTVKALKEELASEAEKTAILSFDGGEQYKEILIDLKEIVGSSAIKDLLTGLVDIVNFVGAGITGLTAWATQGYEVLKVFKEMASLDMHSFADQLREISAIPWIQDSFLGKMISGYAEKFDKSAESLKEKSKKLKDFLTGTVSFMEKVNTQEVSKNLDNLIIKDVNLKPDVNVDLQDVSIKGAERIKKQIAKALDSKQFDVALKLQQKLIAVEKDLEKAFIRSKNLVSGYADAADALLDPETLKSFREEIQKLDFSDKLSGLEGWTKVLETNRQKAIEWGQAQTTALDESHYKVQELAREMDRISLSKGLKETQRDIEALKFDGIVNGLRKTTDESKKLINNLKADFISLQEQAFKQMNERGLAFKVKGEIEFTDKGKEYFKELAESSGIFEDAIKSAQDKVKELQQDLEDTKFDFKEDIYKEKQKINNPKRDDKVDYYKYQLAQIKRLRIEAEKAANAGSDGWKRQVELLEKAYGIAKSMDATKNADSLKGKVQRAYAIMKQFENASSSAREGSKRQYLEAKAEYEAAKRGDVDTNMQKRKISEMEILANKILQIKDNNKKSAEEELAAVEEYKKKATESWETVKEATESAQEVTKGYAVIIDSIGNAYGTMADGAIKELNRVIDKQKELNSEIKKAFSGSNYNVDIPDGARAAGGPVEAGKNYLVGERGVEMFSPKTSGYIVPNHELEKSSNTSQDFIDINLHIGTSKPIKVKGDTTTLEDIRRAEAEQKRFAA